MAQTYRVRTEITYEVASEYGQTIRVIHEPAEQVASIALIGADDSVIASIDFEVKFGKVARALSEMFNRIDDEQLAFEESKN
jgi:hypothetical protein